MNTRGKGLRVETVEENDDEDDDPGLDKLHELMSKLDKTGGPPTSVGGDSRKPEAIDSALSADSDSFSFVAESVDAGSRGSKSSGGKNCYFVVLRTGDGVGRCMGRRGKTKICWLEDSICPHPSHKIGKVTPAWGELCLMVEDGKAVEGDSHLPLGKLLPTDDLDVLLTQRGAAKDLKSWIKVRNAATTPTGARKNSSWTEADVVSTSSIAHLDSNPSTKSDPSLPSKGKSALEKKGLLLPSMDYNDIGDTAVKSSMQLLHSHLAQQEKVGESLAGDLGEVQRQFEDLNITVDELAEDAGHLEDLVGTPNPDDSNVVMSADKSI
ncbi:MAG: hypothetical protein SGARI_005139, partial [Bacillariaceae sp.]